MTDTTPHTSTTAPTAVIATDTALIVVSEPVNDKLFDDCYYKTNKCVTMLNEMYLHRRVVQWLRRFRPDAVIIAGLGELQDTEEKKLDAYNKGYTKGTPDLIVFGSKGKQCMIIELKTPIGNGEVSTAQRQILMRLKGTGFKVLVSNDYDYIIEEIRNHIQTDDVEDDG